MNIEDFRMFCLSLPEVTESFPFDENTLVFKVAGKMFALTGLEHETFKVNLKCDPDRAIELRASHPEITAGYHMSKKHWNTVEFEGGLEDKMLRELLLHSYDLVVKGLKKADRERVQHLRKNVEK